MENLTSYKWRFKAVLLFYYGCGYVPIANEKGRCSKEDDSEGASKCLSVLNSNLLGRVFSVLESF